MDIKIRYLLKQHRARIVRDVDVDDIINNIISSETLTSENIENVKLKTARSERINTLIDIVSKNGPPCYMAFVNSLQSDYEWLYELLQIKDTIIPIEMQKDALEDILHNGNVPKLPIHHVKRSNLENQLHNRLTNLKRHETLALHGMSGSGKSSIVNSTLRNNSQLVFNGFNGKVFWISVSDCVTDDQIIHLQSCLYRRLERMDTMSMSTSTSSINIGSMEYSDYSIQVDQDWKEYRSKLTESFSKDPYKEALLIVDDPRNKEIVEAFDVGCKLLVTTQDSSFVDSTSYILKVSNSLLEEESLQLISLAIEEDVNKLPDEAKKMHHICQGTPLLMAMLGGLLADNKDSLKHDRTKWKLFLKALKNNKTTFLNRMNSRKNVKDYNSLWIEMGINSLDNNELKLKYKSLAILPDNIKVSVKALAVILNMSENQVEDFVTKLEKKSLIVKHFNIERKTYEYEIHDLIMSHLKNNHTENELKRLHSQLIDRYKSKCLDGNLVHLPDDGYIAYYIGYHVSKIENPDEMFETFKLLFTNLDFIGNKIRLVGPSDTIEDLKKYADYILKSKCAMEFISSIGKFISNYGHDLHYYPYTDILQSVMQNEPSGNLFDEASSLAKKEHHSDHAYFQFLPTDDSEIYTVMNIGSEFSYVKFWTEFIFIGHTNGTITLWSVDNNQKIQTFYGHRSAIKSISISYSSPCKMGSVCDDGVIHIWNLNDNSLNEDSSSDAEDETSSMHDSHNSSFTDKHPSGPFRSIVWSKNRNMFLSHTDNVMIIRDLEKKIIEIVCESIKIKCSLFSSDDSLVIVGYEYCSERRFGINMYCSKSGRCIMTFTEYNTVLNILLSPDEKQSILVLTNKYIQKHRWKEVILTSPDQAKNNVIHSKIIELDNESKYELHMMTLGDNDILFISTTDCRILAYNIKRSDLLCEFNNYRGIVSMMDYIEYDLGNNFYSGLLITASGGDQTYAKLWFVNDTQFKSDLIRKTSKFDCVFDCPLFTPDKIDKISPLRETSDSPVRRVKTLSNGNKYAKPTVHKTTSLDRHNRKNLNLNNLSKPQTENSPLVAIVDSNKCVQVFKGNKLVSKTEAAKHNVTCVALSPCGQFLIYGLENGEVLMFTLKQKSSFNIMEARKDPICYLEFLNNVTLVAGGKFSSLMIYEIVPDDLNKSKGTMLITSHQELGSQELLDSYSDRRKSPLPYSKNGSYASSESISSIGDKNSPDHCKGSKYAMLYRRYPTIKCCLRGNIGMLSVEVNGCIKLWNRKYELTNVLVKNEDLYVTCVCIRESHIVICDKLGNFRIYLLTDSPLNRLNAKNITSHRINEKIVSCALSCENKYLAMGCVSGNIVLWHVSSKILISTIKFHKETVNSLMFSPTPIETRPISNSIADDQNQNEYSTPLVLVSLAGQMCWWDVTYILNKKINRLKNKSYSNKNILSHIDTLVASSPMDFNMSTQSNSSNIGNGLKFEFCTNTQWEKLWRNKKPKNGKRKELLNCIKLKGERAFKIMVNNSFSTFVTIDQGGVLHIMNMLQNNEVSNGIHQNDHSS